MDGAGKRKLCFLATELYVNSNVPETSGRQKWHTASNSELLTFAL